MIILEEPPAAKVDQTSFPAVSRSTSAESPPPYIDQHIEPSHQESAVHPDKQRLRRRKKRRRRILIIFLSFLVYTVVLTTILVAKPWKHKPEIFNGSPYLNLWDPPYDEESNSTEPQSDLIHGKAVSCNDWTKVTPESAQLQYRFPGNSSSFFVNSYDAPLVVGTLKVWENTEPDQDIIVQVSVRGPSGTGLNWVDVCKMVGFGDGSFGLGLYNTSWNDKNDSALITVNVLIPQNVTLPCFTTYLPGFSQVIGVQPKTSLSFGILSLGGPVSQLELRISEARKVTLDTNTPVRGYMVVSQYLSIQSRKSEISANITLVDRGHLFTVELENEHAPIDSIIRIVNLHPSRLRVFPSLRVTASALYAPLGVVVDFPYSSPAIQLELNARTQLAPLMVRVPPSYQGDINLTSYASQAAVAEKSVRDPSGHNRTRTVSVDKDRNSQSTTILGEVTWPHVPSDANYVHPGRLQLTSTMAKGALHLDGPDSPLLVGVDKWPTGWNVG